MHLRRSLASAIFAVLLVVVGCAESTGTQYSEISGVYSLQVPQGGTVSVREDRSGGAIRAATGGVLDLHPDWRFNLGFTAQPGVSWSSTGFYQASAKGVTLNYASGLVQSATLSGDMLTVNVGGGETLVFRKVGS